MTTLVIAPNRRQFDYFVRKEARRVYPNAVNFRFVTRPNQLQGYRGELIIVNANQLTSDELLVYAEFHNDKACPVRWVDLDKEG